MKKCTKLVHYSIVQFFSYWFNLRIFNFLFSNKFITKQSKSFLSFNLFFRVSYKYSHIRFLNLLRLRKTIFNVINMLNQFKILFTLVEGHLIDRVILPTAIIILCRHKNNILLLNCSVWIVGNILFIKILLPLPVVKHKSIHILIYFSSMKLFYYPLWVLQYWVVGSLNSFQY